MMSAKSLIKDQELNFAKKAGYELLVEARVNSKLRQWKNFKNTIYKFYETKTERLG